MLNEHLSTVSFFSPMLLGEEITIKMSLKSEVGKAKHGTDRTFKIKQEVTEPHTQTMTSLVIIGTHMQPLMRIHEPKRMKCSRAGVQRRKELVRKTDAMSVVHFGFNQRDTGQKQSSI